MQIAWILEEIVDTAKSIDMNVKILENPMI